MEAFAGMYGPKDDEQRDADIAEFKKAYIACTVSIGHPQRIRRLKLAALKVGMAAEVIHDEMTFKAVTGEIGAYFFEEMRGWADEALAVVAKAMGRISEPRYATTWSDYCSTEMRVMADVLAREGHVPKQLCPYIPCKPENITE